MLDLTARHRIRAAVDDFTAGRITAFALDDRLHDISTTDSTVTTVIKLLWYTYDDCKDHGAAHWTKQTWDLVQRLLLVLDSASELVIEQRRIWRASQAIALGGLSAMAVLVWGFHLDWFIPVLSGGLLSQTISWWRSHHDHEGSTENPIHVTPFASSDEIRQALRRLPNWRKQRRPDGTTPHLRSASFAWFNKLLWRLLWCLGSPLVLAAQTLPQHAVISVRVIPPGQPNSAADD